MATTAVYTLKDLKDKVRIKEKDIIVKITPDDVGTGISIGSNIKNVTLYFADDNTSQYDPTEFKYNKKGKDLNLVYKVGSDHTKSQAFRVILSYRPPFHPLG